MRLVCRDFNEKTLANYLHTFAARFKPEFCLSSPTSLNPFLSHDQNIFARHGHHVRRFSLCLEVDENELACPPIEPDQKIVSAFWGHYLWPHEEYRRYTDFMQLESAADDTKAVAATLSSMENVREIAISCDPGWGRLLGPERPLVAAKVLHDHGQAIGMPTSRNRPRSGHTPYPGTSTKFIEDAAKRRSSTLEKMILTAGHTSKDVLTDMDPKDVETLWKRGEIALSQYDCQPGLSPTYLKKPQRDFLVESEWASRALVQSWTIGIADVSRDGGLGHLVCLSLAKIPSSHLPILTSKHFWDNLPNLKEVRLGVLADWRRLAREQGTGFLRDEKVDPAGAAVDAFQLLRIISTRDNITTLHFEWICGGELSWGSQRGRYILPAPFIRRPEDMVQTDVVSRTEDLLFLPYVTNLSLRNCWFSPHVFLYVMRKMARRSLIELKLESVSLSGAATKTDNSQEPHPLLRRLRMRAMMQPLAAFAHVTGATNIALHLPVTVEDPGPGLEASDFGGVQIPGLAPTDESPDGAPGLLTWPGIIDSLSSGPKVAPFAPTNDGEDGPKVPASDEAPTLDRMEFKSCGYVAVESPRINTSRIMPWGALASHYGWTVASPVLSRDPGAQAALEALENSEFRGIVREAMQENWSDLNGWIVPALPDAEEETLRYVFGLRMGWTGVYNEQTVALATTVNPMVPGEGRFTGAVSGYAKSRVQNPPL
ncbi:uncharacterized protein DNG_01872 [Cephalotrichum gorgonifer]|uniref:Uncharacterized protein n=1 Tax=Cephalotrichum gorgonifer TaxID=2041049 RepID=A0AAE8SS29_9PEZI|nr:uncharacterized protein DNG_01872 [Cephalotrichum gorgonifer]